MVVQPLCQGRTFALPHRAPLGKQPLPQHRIGKRRVPGVVADARVLGVLDWRARLLECRMDLPRPGWGNHRIGRAVKQPSGDTAEPPRERSVGVRSAHLYFELGEVRRRKQSATHRDNRREQSRPLQRQRPRPVPTHGEACQVDPGSVTVKLADRSLQRGQRP